MYDITEKDSFSNVRQWMGEIDRYAGQNVNKLLVGNKCDLNEARAVTTDTAKVIILLLLPVTITISQQFADSYNMPFIETSAKTGDNVEKMFVDIATAIKHRYNEIRFSKCPSNISYF